MILRWISRFFIFFILYAAVAVASKGKAESQVAAKRVLAKPAKVVLLGIDGVSLNLLEPFAKEGITPNLGKLLSDGARGDLASIWPLRTPQVWTTIITGKLPGQHGIWDHLSNSYFNPPEVRTKDKRVVTTKDRQSKALWTILSEHKIPSLTVGWVPSWPAENVAPGVMVAPVELFNDSRQSTIKGSFWRDQDLVWPKTLSAKVKQLIVEPQDLSPQEQAVFADMPPKGHAIYKMPRLERYVYAIEWSLARAKSVEQLTVGLLEDAQPEVVTAYFQCTDSLLHRFWIFHEDEAEIRERFATHGINATHVAELKKRFGRVVKACYEDVDARVGRILEATRGPDTLVVVVSDHGFGPAQKPHRLKDEPFSGDHRDDGVVIIAGPGVPKNSRIKGAKVADVAPSILHYLGLPVGEDMQGRVWAELLAGRAVKSIPSYEATPQREILHPAGFPMRKP